VHDATEERFTAQERVDDGRIEVGAFTAHDEGDGIVV